MICNAFCKGKYQYTCRLTEIPIYASKYFLLLYICNHILTLKFNTITYTSAVPVFNI